MVCTIDSAKDRSNYSSLWKYGRNRYIKLGNNNIDTKKIEAIILTVFTPILILSIQQSVLGVSSNGNSDLLLFGYRNSYDLKNVLIVHV